MQDDPQAVVFPLGLEDEFPNGPPSVRVTHRGCELILRFAPGDLRGEGNLTEIRLLPAAGETLKPRLLREFAPWSEQYVKFARAAMRIFEPDKQNFTKAAEALRRGSGPGKGLTHKFYEQIAQEYRSLIEEGEQAPVKTIATNHDVKIAAASKWITETRRRFPDLPAPRDVRRIQKEAEDAR